MRDKELLEIYHLGFVDELNSLPSRWYGDKYEFKAYSMGRAHALIGDDVRSVDYLSSEEILETIKK